MGKQSIISTFTIDYQKQKQFLLRSQYTNNANMTHLRAQNEIAFVNN